MEAKLHLGLIKEEERPVISMSGDNDTDKLISVALPTQTRSHKRRHIRTNFDDITVSSDAAEAQRRERERLKRLSKIHEAEVKLEQSYYDEVLGGEKLEPMMKRTKSPPLPDVKPSTSFLDDDVIELSSDEDSDTDIISHPIGLVSPVPFCRQSSSSRENVTDELHRIERERLLKKRLTEEELESKDLTGGRLVVNPGKPPGEPDIFVPSHLNDVLQPHQLGGIRFMYDNIIESVNNYANSPGFGCILAHAMGLGKTLQVIAFMDIFVRTTNAKKILIIVPINTIQNWFSEFQKWLPDKLTETGENIRPFTIWLLSDATKTNKQRAELIRLVEIQEHYSTNEIVHADHDVHLDNWHEEGGVLLIGYDMFRLLVQMKLKKKTSGKQAKKKGEMVNLEKEVDAKALSATREALLNPGPDLVVCDEGHRIKNERTGIATSLSAIKTRRRIVLTGYPLQNNLMEYYCMVDFVRPCYLGSKKEFSVMFERPIRNGLCIDSTASDLKIARQRTHILVELLKGFVQRRTHHLLKKILPPSYEFVLLLRKSPIQRVLYRSFLQYAQTEIRLSGTAVFNPLKAFAVCSKIWNHPDILYEVFQKRKVEALGEISEKEIQCGAGVAVTDGSTDGKNSTINLGTVSDNATGKISCSGHKYRMTPLFFLDSNATSSQSAANEISRSAFRSKQPTVINALLEELNLDRGIKYDWATLALHNYKSGVVQNGYKMVISLALIEQAVMNGEKVLLFSQSLLTLNQIERFLETSSSVTIGHERHPWKRNANYYRFDGSTAATEREKLINRFNEDRNIFLFLISTRAGSLGINLVGPVSASRVIIFDASWNPCHDAQAVCRIYRYGQKKCTYIYRLITDNSMERAILNRQVGKNGLQQRVVDDRQTDVDVTKRELEQLLVYDESVDLVTENVDVTRWQVDDALLWMVTLTHSSMFSQIPFLHENMLLEREEGLSDEEKREARMLYEREKKIYKTGDLDYYDWTLRGFSHGHETWGPRMPKMWPIPPQYPRYPVPLRPTPTVLSLEHLGRNDYNPEFASTPGGFDGGNAVQIFADKDMELPCLTVPGRMGKIAQQEKCWLVTLPTGVFIRSFSGDIYDARGTTYDSSNREAKKETKVIDVIDLCDSD